MDKTRFLVCSNNISMKNNNKMKNDDDVELYSLMMMEAASLFNLINPTPQQG